MKTRGEENKKIIILLIWGLDKSSFKLYLTGKVAIQKSYDMLKLQDNKRCKFAWIINVISKKNLHITPYQLIPE